MEEGAREEIACRDFGVVAASGFRTQPVSFRLLAGSTVALVGAPGCGKSLVFEHLAGVRRPGVRGYGSSPPRDVSLVPQDARLAAMPTDRTHNLVGLRSWPLVIKRATGLKIPKTPDEEKIRDLLVRLRLDPDRVSSMPFRDLSTSERSSVLLAAQLQRSPRFLLIDGWDEIIDDHGRNAWVEVLGEHMASGMGLLISSRRPPRGLSVNELIPMGESLTSGDLAVPLIQKPKAPEGHSYPLLEVTRLTATRSRRSLIRPRAPAVLLDGASLFVRHGECLVLLGASGAGKTTLLKTVAGLTSAQKGSIVVDNHDVTYARGARARRLTRDVQLVFQDATAALDGMKTVAAHLEEAMALNPKATGTPSEWLERLGLSPRLLRSPADHLSASESQRIDLARSLVLAPKLVLFDAPEVAAADADGGTIFAAIRAEKSAGRSFLVATSKPQLASAIGDRVAVMHAGRILELGDSEEVLRHPGHPVTLALLEGKGLDPSAPTERMEGCPHVARCPRRRLPECSESEPMLAPLVPLRQNGDTRSPHARRVACFHPITD